MEFHSLSKTFNMTGWRVGFAVGNKSALKGLSTVKENLDSGLFNAIQYAGIAGLEAPDSVTDGIRSIYQDRRDFFTSGLKKLGWQFQTPEAAFYLWVKVPKGYILRGLVRQALEEAGRGDDSRKRFWPGGGGLFPHDPDCRKTRLEEALQRFSKLK